MYGGILQPRVCYRSSKIGNDRNCICIIDENQLYPLNGIFIPI